MTEALLAVEHAADGQAQLLGLVQELRCQIAVGKVPEVCAVLKGEGDAQQLGLVAAVAGQCESRDTADVDGSGAAQDGVQNVVLRTQNAGSLHVDDDGTAGQLLDLLLEVRSGLANDGVQRVDLGVDQSHLGIVCSSSGITCGRSSSGSCGRGGSSGAVGRTATCGQSQSSGGNTGGCQEAATRDHFHKFILLKIFLGTLHVAQVCSAFINCSHFSKIFLLSQGVSKNVLFFERM